MAGRLQQADYSRAIAGDLTEVSEYTRERAESWFSSRLDSMKWAIEIDGRLAGEVRLDRIDQQNRNASIAIGIFSPELWSRGFGTRSVQLVLNHAFIDLKIRRIWLMVMESNTQAVKAYEKCGFVTEGRLRESVRTSNGWESDLIMAILRNEYLAKMGTKI